jgi:hypothetical protein
MEDWRNTQSNIQGRPTSVQSHGINSLVNCQSFTSTCLSIVQPQHCAQSSVTVQYQIICRINGIKQHAMKTSAKMEVNLHAVLTLAVDKNE